MEGDREEGTEREPDREKGRWKRDKEGGSEKVGAREGTGGMEGKMDGVSE